MALSDEVNGFLEGLDNQYSDHVALTKKLANVSENYNINSLEMGVLKAFLDAASYEEDGVIYYQLQNFSEDQLNNIVDKTFNEFGYHLFKRQYRRNGRPLSDQEIEDQKSIIDPNTGKSAFNVQIEAHFDINKDMWAAKIGSGEPLYLDTLSRFLKGDQENPGPLKIYESKKYRDILSGDAAIRDLEKTRDYINAVIRGLGLRKQYEITEDTANPQEIFQGLNRLVQLLKLYGQGDVGLPRAA